VADVASAKKATFVSQPKGSKRKINPYKNLINYFSFTVLLGHYNFLFNALVKLYIRNN